MTASNLNTSHSEAIFNAAKDLMPGGVSSPVRAFKSVGGQPIVFDRVKGPYAWDVDGNKYVDYIGSWGPAICGHAHPEVISALQEAIEKGTSFGAPCALENTLAEMVIEAVPSVEMVRFVNSGTEACMSMLRLIRQLATDGDIRGEVVPARGARPRGMLSAEAIEDVIVHHYIGPSLPLHLCMAADLAHLEIADHVDAHLRVLSGAER